MSFIKSEKFQKIFFPVFYVIFAVAITVSACSLFENFYYTDIFISGISMMPTLFGGDAESQVHQYGIADTTDAAINGLKRFDVVIANYPEGWGSSDGLIVKRVWGFPGETISLTCTAPDSTTNPPTKGKATFTVTKGSYKYQLEGIYENKEFQFLCHKNKEYWNVFTFKTGDRVFSTNSFQLRNFTKTLGEDEYFIMGDNWGHSTDSYVEMDKPNKLTRKFIKGKVVCIQGYGDVKKEGDTYKIINKQKTAPLYRF